MKRTTIAFLLALAHFNASAEEPVTTRSRETSPKQIQAWINDLAAEAFLTRERAHLRLVESGKSAVTALSAAADDTDPEVRSRAHRILFQLEANGDDHTREAAEKAIRKFASPELDRIQYQRAVKWLARLRKNTKYEEGQLVKLEIFNEQHEDKNDRPTDQDLVHLRYLPALKKLTFHTYKTPDSRNITDAGLVHLGKLADLESLSIGTLAITDVGLESLSGLKSLKWLSLSGMQVGSSGLTHLAKLPSLEFLSLSRETVTKAHLTQLKQFKSLQGLLIYESSRLARAKRDDDWLLHFNGFPQLKSLSLSLANTDITSAGVAKLRLTNMEKLFLECGDLQTIDLRGCKGTTKIHLTLGRLASFEGAESLASLHLERCLILDAGLAHLKNISSLQHLTLESTTISAVGLSHLRNLKSLESLSFSRITITREVMDHLKEVKSLRSLSFVDTHVPGGLSALRELKALESLKLWDSGLSQNDAKVLQEALPNCSVNWGDSSRYAP